MAVGVDPVLAGDEELVQQPRARLRDDPGLLTLSVDLLLPDLAGPVLRRVVDEDVELGGAVGRGVLAAVEHLVGDVEDELEAGELVGRLGGEELLLDGQLRAVPRVSRAVREDYRMLRDEGISIQYTLFEYLLFIKGDAFKHNFVPHL